MSNLELVNYGSGYAWLRPEADPCAKCGNELEGTFWFIDGERFCLDCGEANPHKPVSVQLRTGQWIIDVNSTDIPCFLTGWLSGSLYVSHDSGKTWQSSDIAFRVA